MPGMGSGLSNDNPTIVSAFRSLLAHEALAVMALLVLVAVAWSWLKRAELRQAAGGEALLPPGPLPFVEAPARKLLRIGFGLLWILDGILQAQPQMPLGMTSGVIEPVASASPTWVQHVANFGATIWSYHPIAAPASAVWIQVGIGIWLLVAPRGLWSRLGGLASLGWGLAVWVFGEAFGGMFAPGASVLFGLPGAVLFYVAAGALIAMPERRWTSPRLGRALLAVMGLFLVGTAVLQAWPGRGFWSGRLRHGHQPDGTRLGTLADMAHQMASTPQPRFLSSWVHAFSVLDAAHGFAVNLFVVVALALLGLAFLSGRLRLVRWAVAGGTAFCLADWVLVEDLGFFGGIGTDPNSMVPMALLLLAGHLALAHVPEAVPAVLPSAEGAVPLAWRQWRRWLAGRIDQVARRPGYLFRTVAALGAAAVVLIGVVPMAVASTDPNASPIIAEATDGSPGLTDVAAPPFRLVDQRGRPVSLEGLRGKVVVLTFLDPVCTNDCPVIAQELREADSMLPPATRRHVEILAVDANPVYRATAYLAAFDRQEGLGHLPNWRYLTGSAPQLAHVWAAYGVQVAYEPGGAMIGHSDLGYVIDARGRIRASLETDPGPATQASRSSFAVTLVDQILRVRRGL